MTRAVIAAVTEALDKYRYYNEMVQFKYEKGEVYENEEDIVASTRFGRKYRRQGDITYTKIRSIGDTRSAPPSKYVYSKDKRTVGRLKPDSHYDTIFYGTQFRNMYVTGVICEVVGFGEGLGKFQYVEVCTT